MADAVELVPLDEDSYYQDPQGFFARLRESGFTVAVHSSELRWRPVSLMNCLESLPIRLT